MKGKTVRPSAESAARSIREGDIVAECRILRMGRNLAFGEVLIYGEGGIDPAVQVTSTYALLGSK